ncbi:MULTISPECIES: CDP-alcohol phosphatidyltransferase family protein [unclassified Brenneria]|uniref:CDP-alcohol phosphatidyltransferase family protein n=1 Tax=unclassified Brenneria TaxID=2634434 RepID=UPI0029C18BA9|nr:MULTISPECIES: CDP-alcohol phosphatidyltransferase family protein [unclassified Brenneria]MDX5629858.1 CDP-alcohol phosphatidyltransferase family protein [Brenneria sp. L3-3Z]MDX5697004.1 CDP-alcohol phosphatidyltransferase family protein [Brenneria sp. L4-2C]MEE3663884.1 CDP-alcohol phosphatidyltransferase family protein [Brenneria sp. g21c3]
MTLYEIKPKFQNLLRPIVVKLHRWGVSANQVTLLAMLISVILGGLLMLFPVPFFFISLPIYLFFRMALNAIDGMLAREFNQQTTLGAMLNEVGDIISDAALYLAFAFLAGVWPWLVVLVVLLSWLTEFCGVITQTLTRQRNYRGPLGKSDRAFLFGALGLGIALWPQYVAVANAVFIIAAVLLVWTCINRCRSALEAEHV